MVILGYPLLKINLDRIAQFKGVAERGKETNTRIFFFRALLDTLPEGLLFISVYFFSSLFHGHVDYDDFSYMLHPCTCMLFSMLLPCLIHEALFYIS